jgi:hypothetical protein
MKTIVCAVDESAVAAEAITVASGLNKEPWPEAGHARLASAGRPA